MNFCLSDLVPPLRWSDTSRIELLVDQTGLPPAWWRSLPLERVLAVFDADALAELLTELALEHWPAAAIGDVLPALYVLDPEEADDPQVAIALDRAGSWPGLLSLTGRELADQPFIKARPVLNALFAAVFHRFSPVEGRDEEPRDGHRVPAAGPVERRDEPVARAAAAPMPSGPAAAAGPITPIRDQEPAAVPAASPEAAGHPQAGPAVPPHPGGPQPLAPAAGPAQAAPQPVAAEPAPAAAQRPPAEAPQAAPQAVPAEEPQAVPQAVPADGPQAAPHQVPAEAPLAGPQQAPAEPPQVPQHVPAEPSSAGPQHMPAEPPPAAPQQVPAGPQAPAAPPQAAGPSPAVPQQPAAEHPPAQPPDHAGVAPAAAAGEHAPDAAAVAGEAGAPAHAEPAVPAQTGPDLLALIDAAFADLDDCTWMVAQNVVFTDAPTAPEELAKLLAVPPDAIHTIEIGLRVRLSDWLALPEAVPYREHLNRVVEYLGKAAPKRRLIEAADWHKRRLRSLDVPAWHFVLATLPGYRVHGDWLVSGDLAELREQTLRLIAEVGGPVPASRAVELVSTLGIRPEVAKEWLDTVPQLRVQRPAGQPAPNAQPVPEGAPAAGNGATPPGNGVPAPGAPVPGDAPPAPGNAPPVAGEGAPPEPVPEAGEGAVPGPEAADAPERGRGPLKDVALTRRCFRDPDGHWWLRVDVTAEHLQGEEVALPTGFAAYLGLSPGESRTVRSAFGDLTLSWQNGPTLGSLERILAEESAEVGGHLFLTVSGEGMLRVRYLAPAANGEPTARALRLAGYTAPGSTEEQAMRVIATRIGLTGGPVGRDEVLARLRERGDRDLLSLLG